MRVWLVKRVRSVRYAGRGISHLVRTQPNAWIHVVSTAAVLLLATGLRVSAADWCWLIAAMAAVWMAEALNTAVELLADAACPQHHPLIGHAKDVAAGGVLLAALGAVGIGALVFVPAIASL
jgi:diacylglycerol kinase (ATP)